MLKSLLVIAVGASLGAWLRWLLGMKLNALFPTIPPGTVVANMVGGYIIGLAIAFLAASPSLSPEWRLLIITGFCGGLTTFSTFSAEDSCSDSGGQIAVGTRLGFIARRGLVGDDRRRAFVLSNDWHALRR
jgi:protein CrcB